MRAVALLGLNFVRMQWIALAVMTAYLLGIAWVFHLHAHTADVLFFLRWHAGYALFLSMGLTAPALELERKTRRILAVLSKGIHRWQYLGGILCGSAMVAALFCGLIGAIAAWLCRQTGAPSNALGPVILALFCCCIAAAATGLLFATFLHPFLATLAASIVLSLPLFVELLGRSGSWQLFPVAWMVHFLLGFQLQPPGKEIWEIAATALCQIAVFWMAAAAIFARRDVTISPE
jgi:hypothetical protein